jgi:2'-5' RNA ligase
VFDSHVVSGLSEAAGNGGKLPQSISAAYDEYAYNGDTARSAQGMTARERKETLLAIYLNNPWVSACVDVIAKRITSGGLVIEPTVEKPNEKNRETLEKFALRVNDDWDMLQYVRASITDELIFGDTYTEIVWKDGLPYQLYKIDGITMSYKANRYGHIEQYYQQLDSTTERNPLDPRDIVRWWFPHPRAALDPFSPIERVQDAVLLDKKMVNWLITFFQKGAKFPYSVEFQGDKDEADRFLMWFRANYTGEKNAHLPPVTYNGAKINPSGKGSIDIDFDRGLDRMRGIVLTAYHVPPAIVGIIESGNIGGGTGEDQEKSFQYNACDPVRHTFFEKFNYRIVQTGFGIYDYRYTTRYADFRNDEALAKVQDMHVRNGTLLIDEARAESGKKPYADGVGAVPVIITTKEITPVPRLKDLEDEARQTAQVELDTKQAQLDKLKEPPSQGATNQPEQPVQKAGTQKPPEGKTNEESTSMADMAAMLKPLQGKAFDIDFLRMMIEHHAAAIDMSELVPERTSHDELKKLASGIITAQTGEITTMTDWLASWYHTTPTDEHARPVNPVKIIPQPFQEAGQDHSTGMMLAFLLDKDTAQKLALPGGETIDDLHITLAYLGDMEDDAPTDGTLRPDTSPHKIREAIAGVASQAQPLTGVVGGLGRFFPAETDTTPIIALVDVPGLVEFRTKLVTAVQAVGYHAAANHGYTPHITLDYIDASAPMPIKDVPALPLILDTVTLCIGEERIPFRLGKSEEPPQKQESASPVMTKAALTKQIAALFDRIIARGTQDGADIHTAFSFTHSDYEAMADLLARGYLSAKEAAHAKAASTVASRIQIAPWHPQASDEVDARLWAQEQVQGLGATYQQTVASLIEKLSNESSETRGQLDEGLIGGLINAAALAAGVAGGIKAFVEWKAPQIANVVIGSGSQDGIDQAIEDILDAAAGADGFIAGGDAGFVPGMSGTPDGGGDLIGDMVNGGLDRIGVQCVPAESSSDICSEYAGNTYTLEEYANLEITFPAHPNCPHEWQLVILDDGGEA